MISSVTWLIVELKFIVFVKLVNCGQEFLLNPTFEQIDRPIHGDEAVTSNSLSVLLEFFEAILRNARRIGLKSLKSLKEAHRLDLSLLLLLERPLLLLLLG